LIENKQHFPISRSLRIQKQNQFGLQNDSVAFFSSFPNDVILINEFFMDCEAKQSKACVGRVCKFLHFQLSHQSKSKGIRSNCCRNIRKSNIMLFFSFSLISGRPNLVKKGGGGWEQEGRRYKFLCGILFPSLVLLANQKEIQTHTQKDAK